MLKRILLILLAVPMGALLVALAVANRHEVRASLDPFNPHAHTFSLPLFAFILASLIVGAVLGGMATWLAQSQWRREARVRGREAKRWHAEADRLTRERDAIVVAPARQLAAARR